MDGAASNMVLGTSQVFNKYLLADRGRQVGKSKPIAKISTPRLFCSIPRIEY